MITFAARSGRVLAMLLGAAAMPALAQNGQTPTPQPQLIPGLEHYSLPSGPNTRPTPLPIPTPAPTVAAAPTPLPTATRALTRTATPPSAKATERPRPLPAPSVSPLPPIVPTGTAPPVAGRTEPVAAPAPVAEKASTAEPAPKSPGRTPILAIGGAAAALVLLGWLAMTWYRRRQERDAAPVAPEYQQSTILDLGAARAVPALPIPAPPEPALAPAPPLPRAELEIEVRPKRAGTNLLSAAVEYEVIVRNMGAAAARAIRVDIRMLSAGTEQDATIRALFAAPIDQPVTPPFDLGTGEHAALEGTAMMPRESMRPMMMQGRALFVPIVTVSLLYAWDGGAGQTASAHVIGIDRGDGAKLAPFRIDGAPRMHSGVGQLPYTIAVRR